MKISIIGAGYVGLSVDVGFAIKGNNIICMDKDSKRVEMMNSGESPVFELGLENYLDVDL